MKKSTKWFLFILSALLLTAMGAMTIFYLAFSDLTEGTEEIVLRGGDRLGLVELRGVITSSEDIVKQVKKLREDRTIRGVVLRIESPGGGVVASQEIYEEVKRTRDQGKPVVVSMGSVAASGGYYVACGASRIVANLGTLTGSIGVISHFMRFDPMLDKVGIGVNTIKSGKFKDSGSPFREMSNDDRTYFQSMMDDVHLQFVSVVERERHLSHDSVLSYADGRVFTGDQAHGIGLIDTLGTFEDAIEIAANLSGIRGKPSMVRERKRGLTLLERILGASGITELAALKGELLDQPILQYRMVRGF